MRRTVLTIMILSLALNLYTSDNYQRFNAAVESYRSQNIAAMKRAAERRLASDPENVQALSLLDRVETFEERLEILSGALYDEVLRDISRDDFEAARRKTEALLNYNPSSPRAVELLSRIEEGPHIPADEPAYEEAEEDLPTVSEDDAELGLQLEIAREYLEEGDIYSLKLMIDELRSQHPTDPRVILMKEDYNDFISKLLRDATDALERGRTVEAIRISGRVLDSDSDEEEALRILKLSEELDERISSVLQKFRDRLYDNDLAGASEMLRELSSVAAENSGFLSAIEEFDESLESEIERLRRYYESRDIRQAEELSQSLREVSPDNERIKELSAAIQELKRSVEEAVAESVREAERYFDAGDFSRSRDELEMALLAAPAHQRATELLDKIVELEEAADNLFGKIEDLIYGREFSEAEERLEEAKRNYPEDDRLANMKELFDRELESLYSDAEHYKSIMDFRMAEDIISSIVNSYPQDQRALRLKSEIKAAADYMRDSKKKATALASGYRVGAAWDIYNELNYLFPEASELSSLRAVISEEEESLMSFLERAQRDISRAEDLYNQREYSESLRLISALLETSLFKHIAKAVPDKEKPPVSEEVHDGYLARYSAAESYIADYNMDEGAEIFLELTEAEDINSLLKFRAHFFRAFALNFLGRRGEAYRELSRVVRRGLLKEHSKDELPVGILQDSSLMELFDEVRSNVEAHPDPLDKKGFVLFKEVSELLSSVEKISTRLQNKEKEFFERAFQLSRQYYRRENLLSTIESVGIILQYDPGNREAENLFEDALESLAARLRIRDESDLTVLRDAVNDYIGGNYRPAERNFRRLLSYDPPTIEDVLRRIDIRSGDERNRSRAERLISQAERFLEDNHLQRAEEAAINAAMLDRNNLKAELLLEEIRYKQNR